MLQPRLKRRKKREYEKYIDNLILEWHTVRVKNIISKHPIAKRRLSYASKI
jgi:hypothetical protein